MLAEAKRRGAYLYARTAFGDFIGFQTAWAYWIAAWVGNAAIAVAFALYVTRAFGITAWYHRCLAHRALRF